MDCIPLSHVMEATLLVCYRNRTQYNDPSTSTIPMDQWDLYTSEIGGVAFRKN